MDQKRLHFLFNKVNRECGLPSEAHSMSGSFLTTESLASDRVNAALAAVSRLLGHFQICNLIHISPASAVSFYRLQIVSVSQRVDEFTHQYLIETRANTSVWCSGCPIKNSDVLPRCTEWLPSHQVIIKIKG